MKISFHLEKAERMKSTIKKLDYEEDYETIIENIVLISSHLINAAMHKLGTLREDRDIKHNRLYGILKRENKLHQESMRVANLIENIEQLRPSHVYGKGKNGKTAKKAMKILELIENICDKILGIKNEKEY